MHRLLRSWSGPQYVGKRREVGNLSVHIPGRKELKVGRKCRSVALVASRKRDVTCDNFEQCLLFLSHVISSIHIHLQS